MWPGRDAEVTTWVKRISARSCNALLPPTTVTARRPARMAKSEHTRARILDAALALFNERGTAAVSTNHIAAAAYLSPGNLYYHFTGKQEIIRALHERYAAAHEGMWDPGPGGQADLDRRRANLATGMELAWEYRFLERELLALLRADPQLRASYRQVYQRRLGQCGADWWTSS